VTPTPEQTRVGRTVLAGKLWQHISDALQTANQLPDGGAVARELEALHLALHEAAHLAESIHYQLEKEVSQQETEHL